MLLLKLLLMLLLLELLRLEGRLKCVEMLLDHDLTVRIREVSVYRLGCHGVVHALIKLNGDGLRLEWHLLCTLPLDKDTRLDARFEARQL